MPGFGSAACTEAQQQASGSTKMQASSGTPGGSGTTFAAGSTTYSANPPRLLPETAAPTSIPVTPGPSASTVPPHSWPHTQGGGSGGAKSPSA